MSNHQNEPREYDAVLGAQNLIPVNAAVLGGIPGLKSRLASPAIEARIAALSEALKYGEAGLNLIIKALRDESIPVKFAAYALLKDRDDLKIKPNFPQDYLPTFEFDVITVDSYGQESSRRKSFASFFPEDLGHGIILEMVYIPGGTFMMGSPNDEAGREDRESPQHQVTVPAFYVGKYPITQAQWEAVMGNINPSYFKGEKRPVEDVCWYDAVEFCEKLSETTGKTYRLLSEAEWEYACRAGTTTPFHFGETITPELVNYNGNESTDVGSFPPNAFGLYDMHGNVWEWCSDKWLDNYNGAPTDGSSWESGNNNRMGRGGSWGNDPRDCRSAVRSYDPPIDCSLFMGFRVACVAAQPPRSKKIMADAKLSPTETFQFQVITLYHWGNTIKTEQRQAEYFSENLGRGVSLEMVQIPGGTFTMGPPDNEGVRSSDRIPQHRVTVPTFYAGKYAITQAQWEAVMRNNPSYCNCKGSKKRPVEQVSWHDAVKFCEKLSQTTGKTYRLLSEAEWEYACRAGTTTPFHLGETSSLELVNYDLNYSTTVGSFPPNAFGLYDMHGNVWEWCSDKWHDNYDGAPTDGSSWKTGTNNDRLLRGGSWYSKPCDCRSANRHHCAPEDVNRGIGFRVACVAAWTA
ncbi:formylglycine-generating enzyme family protein [Microcoleus sp. C2C3]|uniref:formylglycine-generating enzyme family protein n=1 Tax=unclassified Microcoleus TaxID=2642155 RepID=UPI002FD5F4B9